MPEIAYGCCRCGCGGKTTIAIRNLKSAGDIKGEPKRFLIGHGRQLPVLSHFWSHVDKTGDCWVWQDALDKRGYGDFPQKQKHVKAHRMSWELANGAIPEGMCVLHKCDNPPCVNPDHLFLGTQLENMQDCTNKGRRKEPPHNSGIASPSAKLNFQKAEEIRALHRVIPQTAIAARYGVSICTISGVVNGHFWSHA